MTLEYPFKESTQVIQDDLYVLLHSKKGDSPFLDCMIDKLSNDFFDFQLNFFNLINEKTSFTKDLNVFNKILIVCTSLIKEKYLRFEYKAMSDDNGFGLSWSSKYISNPDYLMPFNYDLISIFQENYWKQPNIEEITKKYFYNNLEKIQLLFSFDKLQSLSDFYIPLSNIQKQLSSTSFNLFSIFNKNEFYSNYNIYNQLKDKKEFIFLTTDLDISGELMLINKYLLKKEKTHENTI